MKTALLAAGALAIASLSGAPEASAKDINLSLSIGGPGGAITISGPGPRHHGYGGGHKGGHKGGYKGGYNTKPYWHGYNRPYGHGGRGYGKRYNWRHRPYARHCMTPRDIRWMLRNHGWRGFRLDKLTSGIAVGYAFRDGYRYRIKIDRCSWAIIKASPRGGFY